MTISESVVVDKVALSTGIDILEKAKQEYPDMAEYQLLRQAFADTVKYITATSLYLSKHGMYENYQTWLQGDGDAAN